VLADTEYGPSRRPPDFEAALDRRRRARLAPPRQSGPLAPFSLFRHRCVATSLRETLARWRMHLAAQLLSDAGAKVAAVALDVGYQSEAAFSRAFKKLVGVSPAAWRAGQR
jgi:methylphosphotriester-DNA--protein-cysteine methyltransferase